MSDKTHEVISLKEVRARKSEDAASQVPPDTAVKIRELARRAFSQLLEEACQVALKECPSAVLESFTQCLADALREHADTIDPWR